MKRFPTGAIGRARHDFPEAQLHDALRDEWLTGQGYRVLRFRNQQALDDPFVVVEAIATLLRGGEKDRVEGVLAELSEKDAEPPPAPVHQPTAATLTQPSPIEGEGFRVFEGEGLEGAS